MGDQNELIALLKRNNDLLLVLAKAQINGVMANELNDKKNKKLYALVGKGKTGAQISKELGISTGLISETLQRWESIGALIKEGNKYRRLIDG